MRWMLEDHNTLQLIAKCLELREKYLPLITELAKRRITHGMPIIRPLWYVAPDDEVTYNIDNQFMLGDDILVAPVLETNQQRASIYLLAGM